MIPYSEDRVEFYGTTITYSTGYNSPKLPDGYSLSFTLCESCLTEIIASLQSMEIVDYITGEGLSYAALKQWIQNPTGVLNG